MRSSYQGVWNIIRFNWPFYALSALAVTVMFSAAVYTSGWVALVFSIALGMAVLATAVSLAVSFYVYDLSGLYELKWLNRVSVPQGGTTVNFNAGFDETSELLRERFPEAEMIVYDFYDPAKHTEASIARARKAYPPFPGTRSVSAAAIPLADGSAANVFAIMSAHEIRDASDRDAFFSEIARCLADGGNVVVVEHLRDLANAFAYNVGALHFHSRKAWLKNFANSGMRLESEIKLTPFVTAFFLKKDGTAS